MIHVVLNYNTSRVMYHVEIVLFVVNWQNHSVPAVNLFSTVKGEKFDFEINQNSKAYLALLF